MKTTRTLITSLFVAACSVLTACGGTGDESGSGVGSGGSGGAGSQTIVTLTASVVQDTVCNTQVPATTAELVVYDDNWLIKSRHTADANGKITATIASKNTVNISLIGTTGTGSTRNINVDTFTQHPAGDIGVVRIPGMSQQGCECKTTTVEVTTDLGIVNQGVQISGNHPNSPVYLSNINNNSAHFDNVEVCRATGGAWPTLYAASRNDEYVAVAGHLSDYDPSTPLILVMDKTPVTRSVNVDGQANYQSVMHTFGDAYIALGASAIDANVALFENMPNLDAYTFRAYNTRTEYNDGAQVRIGRMQRKSIAPPYNTTLNVTLPAEQETEQLLLSIFAWLASESNRYDFSISNYETVAITLATTLTDGTRYNQTFYGPKRGIIPDNILPTDYAVEDLLDEENITLYISMIRYGEQQSYQQYLASYIAASRMTNPQRLLGNRSEFNSIFVDIYP